MTRNFCSGHAPRSFSGCVTSWLLGLNGTCLDIIEIGFSSRRLTNFEAKPLTHEGVFQVLTKTWCVDSEPEKHVVLSYVV